MTPSREWAGPPCAEKDINQMDVQASYGGLFFDKKNSVKILLADVYCTSFKSLIRDKHLGFPIYDF